ncbi:MAG: TonB-dependent siderophore receptor [Leptolyngbya sp. SIO1E4]|nr:TonB-dependent siderophore receptor [Leptolyngbya sp. SIO1E4]
MMGKALQVWNLVAIATVISGQAFGVEAAQGEMLVTGQQIAGDREQGIESGENSVPYSLLSIPQYPSPQPATIVTEWIAQIEASRVQITNVRLEETDEVGLQVVLETADGELAAPTTTVSGNALIAEIPNAMLALPEGDEFQQFEPVDGIALVQVTELSGDRVQVVITGTETAPAAEFSTTAAGLTLEITPGIAQAGTADEPLRIVVTGEEGSRYVEPNTSTATRTDTPLRDIPQSIQVIPREVLEDQQVIRLNDAIRNVSGGATVSRAGDGQRFLLRGFESPSVLRDGFRLTFGADGNSGIQELSNVETIEVLKGPASILFGSLEPGGVINLVTEQPLSEPFYELGLRIGNQGLIEPSLDFSGPLTEDGRLLYRLNVLHRTEDSFRGFNTDFKQFFIAPVISWQISDRTDLTVHFEYLDSEGPSDIGLVAVGEGIADIPFDRVLGHPEDAFQSERVRVGYDFEHRLSDSWRVRNAFRFNRFDSENAQFINFVLNPVTGDAFQGLLFADQRQDHYELQTNLVGEFNTGSISHTLLAGVDLFRRDNPRVDRRVFAPPRILNIFNPAYGPYPDLAAAPITNNNSTRIDALGLYIQDQIDLWDNLILLLGVRYETVEQETVNNLTSTATSLSENAFSPRIGLVYQPIEALSLYGSYSTSFVPSGAITANRSLLGAEQGKQFEIGARAELLEGRLTANLALFNLTKQNVAVPDPNFPGMDFSIATRQRSRGVELDVAGEILPGWNIITNYAYTDAIITDNDSGNEGNRLFSAPEHNFNLWTTYDIQSGSLEGLGFGLGLNYVGDRFGDNANSFRLGSYFLTNATVSYQRDNWRAGLNIRNLFDVNYIEGSRNSRTLSIPPGDGFTLIGSFSIEF